MSTRLTFMPLTTSSFSTSAVVMKRPEVPIRVELGLGAGRWTVYTCDLTKEYVEINGDYRS